MNNKQRSKAIIDMLLEENKELKRQLKRVKDSYASILSDNFKNIGTHANAFTEIHGNKAVSPGTVALEEELKIFDEIYLDTFPEQKSNMYGHNEPNLPKEPPKRGDIRYTDDEIPPNSNPKPLTDEEWEERKRQLAAVKGIVNNTLINCGLNPIK